VARDSVTNSRTIVKKVPISGGQPQTVAQSPGGGIWGATWRLDDQIIFSNLDGGLFGVSAGGGEPELLTRADRGLGELGHALPSIIPGANAVLFVTASAAPLSAYGEVAVLDRDTGEVSRLGLPGGVSPQYVSTGHLVYGAGDGSVRAVPFDAASLRVTGDSVSLVDGVVIGGGASHFSVSDAGTLVYLSGTATGPRIREFVWVDENGGEEPLSLPARSYMDPRLSPDGGRIAVSVGLAGGGDLWVYDADTGAGQRVTQDYPVRGVAWTPDGRRIFFGAIQGGGHDLHVVPADNSGPAELLRASEDVVFPNAVSSDGKTILVVRLPDGLTGPRELWEVTVDGSAPAVPLRQGAFKHDSPEYSPSGNWVVFQSDESGASEVYVQPYPGPGPVIPVSIGGGTEPLWAKDGSSRLFYRRDDQMIAVPFDPGSPVPVGSPSVLFEASYFPSPEGARVHQVAPDGRFLLMKDATPDASEHPPAQVVLVQNWFEDLKARVPID
jgi:Tol biopolymer transport system component